MFCFQYNYKYNYIYFSASCYLERMGNSSQVEDLCVFGPEITNYSPAVSRVKRKVSTW